MSERIDKRARAAQFQTRLAQGLAHAALSQAELARQIGADRSTVSQLLSGHVPRLPNGQLVAEVARALGVSTDWLLGLSDRRETAATLTAPALDMPEAPRVLVDEVIFGWHREAAGYKIRHVPATLPDMLKTRAMTRWEFDATISRSPEDAILAAEARLAWMTDSGSDYEIAMPLHELSTFARAEGYYKCLSREIRLEQLDQFLALHERFYPRFRVFLFDAHEVFSAPITVFGPLLAMVYLGRNYMAFRDRDRVQLMTAQFDWLIRSAKVNARDWPDHVRALQSEISPN